MFLYGVMEQGRLVNSSNINALNFEIKITPPNAPSDFYKIELTGTDNEVADIGSGVYIFQTDEFPMSDDCIPFYNPKVLYPNGELVERHFIEDANGGRRKWKVEFSVKEAHIKKTFFAIFPPLNLCDGTTFIFDLPRFLLELSKN